MEHETLFTGAYALDRAHIAPGVTRRSSADVASAVRAAASSAKVMLMHDGNPLVTVSTSGRGSLFCPPLSIAATALGVDIDAALAAVQPSADAPAAPFLIVLGSQPDGTMVTALDVTSLPVASVVSALTSAGAAVPGGHTLSVVNARDFLFAPYAKGGRVRPGSRPHSGGTSSPSPSSIAATTSAPVESGAAADATGWSERSLMALEPSQLEWPLPFDEVAMYGWAKSLMTWHARTRYCGGCGAPTRAEEGGVKKTCTRPGCGESNYPRTDAVVIALIASADGGSILLGRGKTFPSNYYSCLAGFLEGGESVEEAVRREAFEETGVTIRHVQYYASQPWPIGRGTFGQVMIGCLAVADQGSDVPLHVDKDELEDARWVSRQEASLALASYYRAPITASPHPSQLPSPTEAVATSLRIPGPFAIAHQLIKAWVMGDGPTMAATPTPGSRV